MGDFHCRMVWHRTNTILGFSELDIYWNISPQTLPGEYRIRHSGEYKYILGGKYPYEGLSHSFTVHED